MRNRVTKTKTKTKTKKQNRTNAKANELQGVSIKDLNDVSGGACSHAGTCSHAVNQQQQPQRWTNLVRPGL